VLPGKSLNKPKMIHFGGFIAVTRKWMFVEQWRFLYIHKNLKYFRKLSLSA